MKQAVILAGGKGTRLAKVSGDVPKSMALIGGRPLLEHIVETLANQNITDFVFFTGYKSEIIEKHFGDGSSRNVQIRYIKEDVPLGTAGAVLENLDQLDARFLVVYGDTLFNVSVKRFEEFHVKHNSDVSIFLHPNDHPYDSDLVEVSEDSRVTAIHKYPHPEGAYLKNLVNAALYICERKAFEKYKPVSGPKDFIRDVFSQLLKTTKINGYVSREYIKDMGTPERLEKVERDFKNLKIQNGSLESKRPAVFIDRDGTLTRETEYVRSIEQIEIFGCAAEAVREINQSNYLTVMVTNQPVIARGEVTERQMELFHNKLETLLGRDRAFLDSIYYCPHHPDRGFEGERVELKIRCDCRKPEIGLIKKAEKDLNIDLKNSWFVGDMTADILVAQNAGLRSILVRTGMAGRDRKYSCQPDFEVSDIREAAQFILRGHSQMLERLNPLASKVTKGQTIVVGGIARTGKSLAAASLRDILKSKNQEAHVISLDLWLKPASNRGFKVIDRYDLELISQFIGELSRLKAPKVFDLPYYDRHSRSIDARGVALQIKPDDIIIFEGTIALGVEALLKLPGPKIYVETDPAVRKKRFWKEYGLRGMSANQIQALFEERESEEIPFIESTKTNSQEIFCFDGALT